MCLLTFLPAGVMPDADALHAGAEANPDGHGYAVVASDHVVVQRGLHPETMIAAFLQARRRYPDAPALFHSRLTTAGERSVDNCHPFRVGGDPRTVLAHNGILPTVVHPAKGDPRSDTRIAAEVFLPQFGSLRSRRTRLRLERWLTPHNKIVILTVDRRFRQPAYILNEASGIWDGRIWYSNDSYLPEPPPRWGRFEPDWSDWPGDQAATGVVRCDVCHLPLGINDTECYGCGWCLDCGEMPGACFCYTPGRAFTGPPTSRTNTTH